MKNRKILIAGAIIASTTPLIAAACGSKPVEKSDSILFSLAQGKNWPLPTALAKFIDYYNKNQSHIEGFKKVKASFADEHKIFSEFKLIKDVKNKLETNEITKVPNLILGAQSSAYIINQDNRLLDVSDVGVNKDLFESNIANLHSKLSGQTADKLYNLPFDNADVDSVVFNLDLMRLIFEKIKEGGGTVKEDFELYKKAQESKDKGSNVPEESIFKALKVKKDAFKDFTVDKTTFESIKSIREFAKKFAQGVELEQEKINSNTINGEVLSIDYQIDTFFKELYGEIPENKELYELVKTNDKNQPTKINYNLIDNQEILGKFKELWKQYNESIISLKKQNVGDKNETKAFQSIKYMANSNLEWGSWNIMFYNSAISFAASVGANQNRQTPWANYYFVNLTKLQTQERFNKNAKDDDVWMQPQITLTKPNGRHYFLEGGSSIIPIKHGDEKDRATKLFIKWLYTGKNDILNPGILEDNWKTFAKTSGYIIPLKSVANEQNLKFIKEEIAKLEALVNDSNSDEKTKNAAIDAKNYYTSAAISLESILKLSKTSEKVKPIAMVTDDITATIATSIDKALFNTTKYDSPEQVDAEKIAQTIKSAKNN